MVTRIGAAGVVALSALVLVFIGRPHASPTAVACGIGPDPIEAHITQAALIALVDVVDVGGSKNRAPTIVATPSPTATPTIARSFFDTPPARATASPAPVRTPFVYTLDLTGFGATVNIVERYAGALSSPVNVDAADRARIERQLRYLEANPGVYPPCEPDILSVRFERGARYLVIIEDMPASPLHATRAFPVVGDMVDTSSRGLEMSVATYERFFAPLPADAIDDPEDPRMYLTTDRVPLATFVRAIEGIRAGDIPITPPETGTAGLAAGRVR